MNIDQQSGVLCRRRDFLLSKATSEHYIHSSSGNVRGAGMAQW